MDPLDDLAEALRLRLIERARDGGPGAGASLEAEVRELVDRDAAALPEDERAALALRVVRLATGLGPLEPLLGDRSVDEVMVNGPGEVWVERRGGLEAAGGAVGSPSELRHANGGGIAPPRRGGREGAPPVGAGASPGSRAHGGVPPPPPP